jgi:hypothetical protein
VRECRPLCVVCVCVGWGGGGGMEGMDNVRVRRRSGMRAEDEGR